MFGFQENDTFELKTELQENVEALNIVNYQLAELKTIKEQLEAKVARDLNHEKEGQTKYECGKYAVTVKQDVIYSLDKEEYQIYKNHLSENMNPVRERLAYDVDKRKMREVEQYASTEELDTLFHFITKKPAKLSVKVEART